MDKTTIYLLLLLVSFLVLTACEQKALPTPKHSSSENINASPTISFTSTITPPPLASLPQKCPAQAIPQRVFSAIGPVVGQAPVQVAGFDVPLAAIPIPTSNDAYTQYGWVWKLVWEIGPHFAQKVMLHGMNIQTGTLLQFQFLNGSITTSPVLNPQQPDHPQSAISSAYKEWGSYIYIPVAGCYSLEAAWAGGHWQVIFAAGRQ